MSAIILLKISINLCVLIVSLLSLLLIINLNEFKKTIIIIFCLLLSMIGCAILKNMIDYEKEML